MTLEEQLDNEVRKVNIRLEENEMAYYLNQAEELRNEINQASGNLDALLAIRPRLEDLQKRWADFVDSCVRDAAVYDKNGKMTPKGIEIYDLLRKTI